MDMDGLFEYPMIEAEISAEQFRLFSFNVADANLVTHQLRLGDEILPGRYRVAGVQNHNNERHVIVLHRAS